MDLLASERVELRREAARLLFLLALPDQSMRLQALLGQAKDSDVRRWLSLSLIRIKALVDPAVEALAAELLRAPRQTGTNWARQAALAWAERGDSRGLANLLEWWGSEIPEEATSFLEARHLLRLFSKLGAKEVAPALLARLSDLRLRPGIATALAELGEKKAVPSLLRAFCEEPYLGNRELLAESILKLGGRQQLIPPPCSLFGRTRPTTKWLLRWQRNTTCWSSSALVGPNRCWMLPLAAPRSLSSVSIFRELRMRRVSVSSCAIRPIDPCTGGFHGQEIT